MEKLLHKIVEREAVIGILGLGYTGLSLAHEFGKEGFKVIGFDIDASKITKLQHKETYLPFLPHDHLFELIDEKRFIPTANSKDLLETDIKIIAVPTPLNAARQPDLSYLRSAAKTVAQSLRQEQLVVLQSTTYPGTTEEEVLPLLEKESGFKVGKDIYLAYVPEREDAGNPQSVLSQIPRLCGGITRHCLCLAKTLYEYITVKVHPCSSPKIAEAAKAYENTFRLINIAFVDEMKIAFDAMGIDIWEVIEASSTKPFGFYPFYPGPGIGGECIPVDPIYLSWRAKQFDARTVMIETASEINLLTSEYFVQKIAAALKAHQKSLNQAKILLLGVAFKKDVSDIRESPALRILDSLKKKGARVSYHDPLVPSLPTYQLDSIPLDEGTLKSYDCVVITTDHSFYDWKWVCEHSPLIIDTRNATRKLNRRLTQHVVT